MPTVEVWYGGETYRMLGTDVASVTQSITEILASGTPGWLTAYDGHGTRAPYQLLVTPGVSLAICDAPTH